MKTGIAVTAIKNTRAVLILILAACAAAVTGRPIPCVPGDFIDADPDSCAPVFMMERAGTLERMFTLSAGGVAFDARQALALDSSGTLAVEFSAPVVDPGFSAVRSMAVVAPSPLDFKYRVDGGRIVINLGIEPGRLYSVTLNPVALTDSAGRGLANTRPCSFFAYLPKPTPFARWERGFGFVERLGPQSFPINAVGINTIDLKVYGIDPLDVRFGNFPNEQLEVRGALDDKPLVRMDSIYGWVSSVDYGHYMARHIQALGAPQYSAVIKLDSAGVGKNRNVDAKPSFLRARYDIDLKPVFASVSGKDKPGAYLVGIKYDGSDSRYYARVDVTDLCLSVVEGKNRTLFAVTSFTSGKPVAEASIRIEGVVDGRMMALTQGKTGLDGVFSLSHTVETWKIFKDVTAKRVAASKGGEALVIDVRGVGGGAVYSDNRRYDSGGRLRWLTFEKQSGESSRNLRGFIGTERPVYFPGDSVFVKGYVRETARGVIGLPPAEVSYRAVLRDSSQICADYPVTLNEYGGFDMKFALPRESFAGRYRVSLVIDGFSPSLRAAANPQGLSKAAAAPAVDNFAVSGYDKAVKIAFTDFIVAAADTGARAVSVNRAFAAPPPFTLKIRANRRVMSGSAISAHVMAVNADDSLIAGQRVTADLKRISWVSRLADSDFSLGRPEYAIEEVTETVEKRSVLTSGKPVQVQFKNQKPGEYILELSTHDKNERARSVSERIYLAEKSQSGKNRKQSVFTAVTDRSTYEPGQQAKILLGSSHKKALVLAVTEKADGDLTYRWINIISGRGAFALDIRQVMSPRIPVNFLLMSQRQQGRQSTAPARVSDDGKPETVMNTTWITVNPVANMLDVRLLHAPMAAPGKTVDITVSLRDIQGRPRSGEAALWLVDETAMPPRMEKNLDPLEEFIENVESSVTIRDTRNLVPISVNQSTGISDSGNDREVSDIVANNISGINNSDDGNIAGEYDINNIIRKNPKAVLYWNPSIKVGKNGLAAIKITLPSNATNYSVRAIAVSNPDKFGTAKSRISIKR